MWYLIVLIPDLCTLTNFYLDKIKARDFNATNLSTYDFSTLHTSLPHNLIKVNKLIDLIEETFPREGSPYLAGNNRNAAFFTSEKP